MALSSEILEKLVNKFRNMTGLEVHYRNKIADEIVKRLGPYSNKPGSTGPCIHALNVLITQIRPRTDLNQAAQKAAIQLLDAAIRELESEAAEASLEPIDR
ncbi:MAG TPA: hypothetical protein PLK06_02720 [bacterium]|nr:hypothetical protein [bacterium]